MSHHVLCQTCRLSVPTRSLLPLQWPTSKCKQHSCGVVFLTPLPSFSTSPSSVLHDAICLDQFVVWIMYRLTSLSSSPLLSSSLSCKKYYGNKSWVWVCFHDHVNITINISNNNNNDNKENMYAFRKFYLLDMPEDFSFVFHFLSRFDEEWLCSRSYNSQNLKLSAIKPKTHTIYTNYYQDLLLGREYWMNLCELICIYDF